MRFKIDWASFIVGSKFSVFALFYFVLEGSFQSTSPRGAYIWRGDSTEGLGVWGAYIWRGLFSEFYGIPLIIHAGFLNRGISSNGRAPALHAGGTGIDTQVLHFLFLFKLNVLAATFIRKKNSINISK